jgi:hypothetical protein
MTTKEALQHLMGEMKKDPDYRRGWQANIAMAFCDAAHNYRGKSKRKYLTQVDIYKIANDAADNFLYLLGMDTD